MGKLQQATLEEHDEDDYNHNSSLTRNLNNQISTTKGRYRRHKTTGSLPNRIRCNIESLIIKFGQLPVLSIFDFYGRQYGEVLDAEDYGFFDGILELLNEMKETVEVFNNGTVLVCKPRTTTNRPQALRMWPDNLIALHNESNFFNEQEKLYFKKNGPQIMIHPPPLARVFMRNRAKANKEVSKIFCLFDRHPKGIPLLELDDIYFKTYNRSLDKLYFNFTCIYEMVQTCPEIFYIEEKHQKDAIENTETDDIILHDGRYHTHPDLKGEGLNPIAVDENIGYLLREHIIQKTLLIVHEAGSNGLPVNIYLETLYNNFRLDDKMIEHLNDKLTALKLIRLLARAKLIEVKSPGAANDLRIHINEGWDYLSWYKNFLADI